MEKRSRKIKVPNEKRKLKVSVRKDPEDTDALAESIKRERLLNNLIVAKTEDRGYKVVCGGKKLIVPYIARSDKLPVRMTPSISMSNALKES